MRALVANNVFWENTREAIVSQAAYLDIINNVVVVPEVARAADIIPPPLCPTPSPRRRVRCCPPNSAADPKGTDWRKWFGVDVVNGSPGNEGKLRAERAAKKRPEPTRSGTRLSPRTAGSRCIARAGTGGRDDGCEAARTGVSENQ